METLAGVLKHWADKWPDKNVYTYLIDGESKTISYTYGELDLRARAIACSIQHTIMKGERALLLYPPGLDFIAAFFGCLYAGVLAVPAYPPDPQRLNKSLPRLISIMKDATPTVILTTNDILPMAQQLAGSVKIFKNVKWVATDSIDLVAANLWEDRVIDPAEIAFLQYTSGSTAQPKGVMISHENIMYNERMIERCFEHTSDSVFVSWLPQYHDMGLIGNLLQPLFIGSSCYFMAPMAFLKKPVRWLQAISRYKAHTTGAPNFAFELCTSKVTEEQKETLDLSSWKIIYNGAEPIRYESLKRFSSAFARCGLQENFVYPLYGLAEATLLVSSADKGIPFRSLALEKTALAQNRVVPSNSQGSDIINTVSCGHTWLEQRILIVDPDTCLTCSDQEIGEIWLAGKNIARGYWNQPEKTREAFDAYTKDSQEGPFFRTGDLGFMHQGELFVTGRIKDLIKIRGRSLYPQDIETSVEALRRNFPEIRLGCIAAFAFEQNDEEFLGIMLEVSPDKNPKFDASNLVKQIGHTIFEDHEASVQTMVLIEAGHLPKTSSGKIMRHACRQAWLNGFGDGQIQVIYPLENAEENQSAPKAQPKSPSAEKPSQNNHETSRIKTNELLQWLREYATRRINSRLIDERRTVPPYVVLDFGNKGLLAMRASAHYGGLELTYHDHYRVIEQMAAIDLTLAIFLGINNGLGIHPILHFASEAKQNELLPDLAKGRELLAFALTEPGAGSNPLAITTTATPVPGGWKLNGTKYWIGSGSWAGLIHVIAKIQAPNGEPKGFGAFMVRQGAPGLECGEEAMTMGVRGIVQTSVTLKDVFVSQEDILGEPGMGYEIAQHTMNHGRLGLGAICLGGMKRCAQLMLNFAQQWHIQTGLLLQNPVSLMRFSELTAAIQTIECFLYVTADWLDQGKNLPTEIFLICKTSAPELLYQAADDLIQMLGGRGYLETNTAPQILRDARLIRVFEGPTESLLMFLGSRIRHDSAELERFMQNELDSHEVVMQIHEFSDELNQLIPNGLCESPVARQNLQNFLLGEFATYKLLKAIVIAQNKLENEQAIKSSLMWLDSKCERSRQQARNFTAFPNLLPSKKVVEEIQSYSQSIGQIVQTMPGEETYFDPLLKFDKATTGLDSIKGTHKLELHIPFEQTRDVELDINPNKSKIGMPEISQSSIEDWLSNWFAIEFKLSANDIRLDRHFTEYGIDSVSALMLIENLERNLDLELDQSVVYDYPSIKELAKYIKQNASKKGA